jgi:hypothetical protein
MAYKGFLPDEVFNKKLSTVAECDMLMAEQLFAACCKANVAHKYTQSTWAKHFALLRKQKNVSQKELQEVLDWYCSHIGKIKRMPQAYAASSFHSKYEAICAAKEIHSASAQVAVGKDAERIAKRLEGFPWPKGSAKDLEAAIQISVTNAVELNRRLREPPKEYPERLLRFAEFVDGKLGPPLIWAENWMHNTNVRINNWKEWHGDLLKMAFSVESSRFRGEGSDWSTEWCGDYKMWNTLMEFLKYEN